MKRAFSFGTLFFVLLFSISMESSCAAAEQRREPMAGGYGEIQDLTEERVRNAATFAVTELQQQNSGTGYSFVLPSEFTIQIAKGYRQVVAGMNYKLIVVITISDAGPIPSPENIVGGFGVTVYDKFGELSVTKWGKELSVERAIQILQNRDKFGEAFDEDFGQ
jgi:hypothetical protein